MSLTRTQNHRLKKIIANDFAQANQATVERRIEHRHAVRLMTTVIVKNVSTGNSRNVSTCALVLDVSKSGARIASAQPIEQETLYVRFLTDGAGPNVIESRIAHASRHDHKEYPFAYGIEFHRILSDDDFAELIAQPSTT